MFDTYILKSDKDGKFYIGSTGNIQERIKYHNSGRSRYTKGRGPFRIVYKETYGSSSDAKKREYYLKSLKNKKAIEKLINGPIV